MKLIMSFLIIFFLLSNLVVKKTIMSPLRLVFYAQNEQINTLNINMLQFIKIDFRGFRSGLNYYIFIK